MTQERQSNIELLRILCMFSLLFLHFCVFCIPKSVLFPEQTGIWAYLPRILCSFMTLQVNIFVLISGWFGIHTSWRKIANFYLICVFYSLLSYVCSVLLLGHAFALKDAICTLFPFSFLPGWWFVKAYLFLMLLAPIFNKAIEYMSRREYIWALCALTIINVYCGFFAKQPINIDGCNFMQVMYVYFIGRFLALHVKFDEANLRKWSGIFSVLGVALYATTWIVNDECLHVVKTLTFFCNNNPWSMFNSIVIFLFFTTLHFRNESINRLAKGVFAIYLIHTSIWIFDFWNTSLISIYDSHTPGTAWLIITAIFTFYSVIVLCVDYVRAYMTKPILKGLDNLVNSTHLL